MNEVWYLRKRNRRLEKNIVELGADEAEAEDEKKDKEEKTEEVESKEVQEEEVEEEDDKELEEEQPDGCKFYIEAVPAMLAAIGIIVYILYLFSLIKE